jgi:hypothetical protein
MLIICLAAVTAVASAEAPEPVHGRLLARASAATVPIMPSPEGHEFLRLPTLEFAVSIVPLCAATGAARSISISVADTRLRFDHSEIGDRPIIETTLALPGRQTGPLRVNGFCPDEDAGNATHALYIDDVYTARLSLTCTGETATAIVYATLPLDVRLTCDPGDTDAGEQPDQGESVAESLPRL